MCDPLDGARRGERTDDLLVKHADLVCGDVMAVDPDDAVIFATRFQACEKVGVVGRVEWIRTESPFVWRERMTTSARPSKSRLTSS